jgi:hypothetical protein
MALEGFTGSTVDPCLVPLPGSGIIEYVALDEVDVSAFDPAIFDSAYNQQTDLTTTGWHVLPHAPGSGRFAEDLQAPAQGEYYKLDVSAFMPFDSPAIRGELHRMRAHRYLLRITSGSQVLLLGEPERGLRFSSAFDSGSDGGDTRGHRITFTGVSLTKPPGFVPVF